MSNTGHGSAPKLDLTGDHERSVGAAKTAVATALPNTSCAQVSAAGFVTSIPLDRSRSSRLSRGRSISRCEHYRLAVKGAVEDPERGQRGPPGDGHRCPTFGRPAPHLIARSRDIARETAVG